LLFEPDAKVAIAFGHFVATGIIVVICLVIGFHMAAATAQGQARKH
jgi:hypothetical protein